MGWAFEHGSDDPEIIENLVKFVFASKFKMPPQAVDALDNMTVECFMIWLGKLAKKSGIDEDAIEEL